MDVCLFRIDRAFPLMMTNGIVWWFLWINIIGFIFFRRWFKQQTKATGLTLFDLGLSHQKDHFAIDAVQISKTVLLAAILFLFAYLIEHHLCPHHRNTALNLVLSDNGPDLPGRPAQRRPGYLDVCVFASGGADTGVTEVRRRWEGQKVRSWEGEKVGSRNAEGGRKRERSWEGERVEGLKVRRLEDQRVGKLEDERLAAREGSGPWH